MLPFDRYRWPIFTRAGKADDRPQPTQICVYEAGVRASDPIDLPQRNSPIDIDRNFSAIRPASAALASSSVFARTPKLTPL
jgi:hypothetical protein